MITKRTTICDFRFCPDCGRELVTKFGVAILPKSYRMIHGVIQHECGWTGRVVELVCNVELRKIKLETIKNKIC